MNGIKSEMDNNSKETEEKYEKTINNQKLIENINRKELDDLLVNNEKEIKNQKLIEEKNRKEL